MSDRYPVLSSRELAVFVGIDEGTPVTEDYGVGIANRFNGRIRKVTIELK